MVFKAITFVTAVLHFQSTDDTSRDKSIIHVIEWLSAKTVH